MSDVARLKGWFDSGTLVRPDGGGPTTVDLIRAVYSLCGVGGVSLSGEAAQLRDRIGLAEHLVFLLIDGLGAELLLEAGADGFFRQHQVGELRAVFPSTTAAALTSFATGQYPAQHGIPAWWVYLRDHDLIATVLPFRERFSDRALEELGVDPDDVFRTPSLLPRMDRETLTVTPEAFLEDAYLRYSTGGSPAVGYGKPAEAVRRVVEHLNGASSPTYSSIYLPHLDEMSHQWGPDSPEARAMLKALDQLAGELYDGLQGRARLLITGDHGHVPLPAERVLTLNEGDELLDYLVCPPAGEGTVPFFHLKEEEQVEQFRLAFRERYGGTFALVTRNEAEALELFGPAPLAPLLRERVGDLIGIASQPTALYYAPRNQRVAPHLGVHAGLSRGEMVVPLVLA